MMTCGAKVTDAASYVAWMMMSSNEVPKIESAGDVKSGGGDVRNHADLEPFHRQ